MALNIVTHLWGDWCSPYGVEYVNRLYEGVARNLTAPFSFWCFTDKDGFRPEVKTLPIDVRFKGNLNKICMFGPVPFEGRVIAMDPDNIVTGSLDEIVKYDGRFATLWDWYEGGSGGNIAGFEANSLHYLWDELNRSPELIETFTGGSERKFLRMYCGNVDYWQDLYPKKFISFKVHGEDGPGASSIVCFHGSPRPHECRSPWIEEHWGPPLEGSHVVPFPRNAVKKAELEANLRANANRDIPNFLMPNKSMKEVCIVGGGPSLKSQLPKLRRMKAPILALNGAGEYLRTVGIKPWGVLIVDPREDNIGFLENPRRGVKYFLASTCHPSLFDALKGYDVTMVHFDVFQEQRQILDDLGVPAITIGGGSTVGHRAIYFMILNGVGTFNLFGIDCCLSEEEGKIKHHAYKQDPRTTGMEAVLDVKMNGKEYLATGWMYAQAREFNETIKRFPDLNLKVYGDSLLKEIVAAHSKEIA